MTAARPALRALADALGILADHVDGDGQLRHATDEARAALAAALGYPAASEDEATRSLARFRERAQPPAPGAATSPTPAITSCRPIADVLGDRHAFGVFANLWSVRSRRSWGVGDLTSLGDLAEWAATTGAAFVGVGPLCATRGDTAGACPYSPVSRDWLNPLYLDVEAIPEYQASRRARTLAEAPATQASLSALRAAPRLDARAVFAAKLPVLRILHAEFAEAHEGRDTQRGMEHARFEAREGEPLARYATWCALAADRAARGEPRQADWPRAFNNPRSEEVAAFRSARLGDVSFHVWLQFELDRQLVEASRRAIAAGLPFGLFLDLPLGAARGGFDQWAAPHLFADGLSLGAPPDPLGPLGQDWDLPVVNPFASAQDGHAAWRMTLRRALRHAGLLRIDHALGLARLYCVPLGSPASGGAYLRQDLAGLLAVLAEESHAAGAVIVGEDLGTAAPGFRDTLREWNVLGMRVLPFERDAAGDFLPAAAFADDVVVAASTHDMAPLAAWWSGSDIDLRRELGLLAAGEPVDRARDERQVDRERLLARLRADSVLSADSTTVNSAALAAAVHELLAWTRAPLVVAMLDDLAGETEPANVPGLSQTEHPSWTRRMNLALEDLAADAHVSRAVSGLQRRRWFLRA